MLSAHDLTHPEDASPNAGPFVGPLITPNILHRLHAPYFSGPFMNNQQRYLSHIDVALQYIFEERICTRNTLEAYLWNLQLRELVASCDKLAEPLTRGYVKHGDAKGDHIMVDENDNLTGVIDWEWAYVTTEAEAFAGPAWLHKRDDSQIPHCDLTPSEVILAASYEELGRQDLANHVRSGKIYERLRTITHGSFSPYDQSDLLHAFGPSIPSDFNPPFRLGPSWRLYLIDRHSADKHLQSLLAKCGWDEGKEARAVEQIGPRAEVPDLPYSHLSAEQWDALTQQIRAELLAKVQEENRRNQEENRRKQAEAFDRLAPAARAQMELHHRRLAQLGLPILPT
ncbi:uncharacterized protein I303_103178 [Kwoniella dejecticola CBS 10117]|uniref:Aminoglycoside phosphotransferase domain-containing protein n=1 Tax=Kwoniella dejecticola CBS 10117 TaxID=1296121 RepID=A0A1A6AAV0_9TREE|nr:uncharacterized protein I303_03199 [Kwoniella dejecticola CBS 10117]OBR87175.1 hypothetical protein I303_03199 [Kwoniella dejecticola CBS 10117]